MPQQNQQSHSQGTFPSRFGTVGLAASVRQLTTTLIAGCPKPTDPSVASLRGDIMQGKKEPIKHVLRLAYVAIEMGSPVELVVQWAKDFIALVEQYAARREHRQTAGVLPFPEVHARMVTRSIREDADADIATAVVDLNCIASLEKARIERLEAIAADERLVVIYTNRIAALRVQA